MASCPNCTSGGEDGLKNLSGVLRSSGDGGALPDPRPQDHRALGAEDERLYHRALEEHMLHDEVEPIGDVHGGVDVQCDLVGDVVAHEDLGAGVRAIWVKREDEDNPLRPAAREEDVMLVVVAVDDIPLVLHALCGGAVLQRGPLVIGESPRVLHGVHVREHLARESGAEQTQGGKNLTLTACNFIYKPKMT